MIRKPLYESVDLQPKYYVSDDVLRILNIILDFAKRNKDKPLEQIYLEAYHQCVNQIKKIELDYGYITLNELSEGDIVDFVSSIDDDLDDAITTDEEGEYFTNIKIGAVSKRLEPLKEFEVLDFMGDIYNGEDGEIESASNGNGLLRNNLNKLLEIIEEHNMNESFHKSEDAMIRRFKNRKFESSKNNIFELWTDILGFMEDEIGGLVFVDTKKNDIYVCVDQYNGNFAWRFEKKDDKIIVDVNHLTDNAHEKWIIETKEDLDSFMNYFD